VKHVQVARVSNTAPKVLLLFIKRLFSERLVVCKTYVIVNCVLSEGRSSVVIW